MKNIKKVILVIILLAMAVMVGLHKDQFYIEKEYSASNKMPSDENGEKVSPKEITLLGNQEIRQDFIAND